MAPSFALSKALKRARPSGPSVPGHLAPVSSSPERVPYGTSRLHRVPQVDLHTPGGRYRQTTKNAPFTPRRNASPRPLVSLDRTPSRPPRRDARQAQWKTWTTLLIPRLIPVWLELLQRSENLRAISREEGRCDCLPTVRKLKVTLVSLQGISSVLICSCQAPQALLRMGYLVSAPVRPSYAFDVQMLDFMRLLHQRTAPNKTAWTLSLEAFLRARGYEIRGKDVIRRKLTASLRWFTYLLSETDRVLEQVIRHPNPATVEEEESSFWEDVGMDEPLQGLAYLAGRCPACFGDSEALGRFIFDFIVCLDACFTQKRRNPVRGKGNDPELLHHPVVFLTDAEVTAAEKIVNEARPARPPAQPETSMATDTVEEGMKVPKSALDACLESFTAADEKRTKASTKFFADTGVMAMLCRHDQVLWLANMKTAGERQYYAIALIRKLFQHLPPNATVGILYDIGCQLERSIVKWGFIPELRERIGWAVSVFHAYGHQWPCQLVYHPRKRDGFGLSDGEGCERLWSSLEFLIPTLRVSGFHQRLFTLSSQVVFEVEQGKRTLGDLMNRKFKNVRTKSREATSVLADLQNSEEVLEEEWRRQVEAQTRPLTRATGGLANKHIKAILTLMEVSSGLGKEIGDLSRKIARNPPIEKLEEWVESRFHLREQRSAVDTQIESKRNALGIGERQDLRTLLNDKYLETRMKALAVKERLRAKLQGRKFEFERVDRAYRNTANESRLQNHIKSQVVRHQPNITHLVKKFNDLCGELQGLIRAGQATPGARIPIQIESNQTYSLDVDAPIWDDRGLIEGDPGPVPLWLGNDEVRAGIRAWLTTRRCDEEVKRLRLECNNMRVWARAEVSRLREALAIIEDPGIRYQLEKKERELGKIIASWKHGIGVLAPTVFSGDWGDKDVEATPLGGGDDNSDSQHPEPAVSDDGETSDSSEGSDAELEAEDRILLEMESMNILGSGNGSDSEWEQLDDSGIDNHGGEAEDSDRVTPRRKRARRI